MGDGGGHTVACARRSYFNTHAMRNTGNNRTSTFLTPEPATRKLTEAQSHSTMQSPTTLDDQQQVDHQPQASKRAQQKHLLLTCMSVDSLGLEFFSWKYLHDEQHTWCLLYIVHESGSTDRRMPMITVLFNRRTHPLKMEQKLPVVLA